MTQSLTTTETAVASYMPVMNIEAVLERRNAIVEFVRRAMVDKTDYGVIPGAGEKKTLLKPGAEKLCTLFGMTPRFVILSKTEDWTGTDHGGESLFAYQYACQLYRGNAMVAEGVGSCNSFEKKYRYRDAKRVCPACGKDAIIKGKAEYGGGWLCFKKSDGCGSKFLDNAPEIINQQVGKVPNPDVADVVNTIDKMAQKRALIAAVLIAVNASEFFTQDMEDFADYGQAIDGDFHTVEKKSPAQSPSDPVVDAAQRMGGVVRQNAPPAQPSNGGKKTDPTAKRVQLVGELARVNGLLASAGLLDILTDNRSTGDDSFSDLEAKIKRANDALEKQPA